VYRRTDGSPFQYRGGWYAGNDAPEPPGVLIPQEDCVFLEKSDSPGVSRAARPAGRPKTGRLKVKQAFAIGTPALACLGTAIGVGSKVWQWRTASEDRKNRPRV
jgi:hypothetical protein